MSNALILLILLLGFCKYGTCADPAIEEEEIRARAYVKFLDKKTSERDNMVIKINWDYASNLTNHNLMKKVCKVITYFILLLILYLVVSSGSRSERHKRRLA